LCFQDILILNHYKAYILITTYGDEVGGGCNTNKRDEKCIHSFARETLKGRELFGLLAGRWQDNIKELGREDVD
jgi:hypothetical protein